MLISDFSKCCVMVIGDIMLDRYIWGNVERISPEAPIPVVHIKERTSRLGGAGNVAANLAGLGCRVRIAGIIGRDTAGKELRQIIEEKGIENYCIESDSVPTVTKTRVMGGQQQIVRIDDEHPDGVISKDRAGILKSIKPLLKGTGAVIISDYGKGVVDKDTIQKVIALCLMGDIPVFVDPKYSDWTAYAGATCITPNSKEFDQACMQSSLDSSDPESSALSLLTRHRIEYLLLTKGSEGMSLYNRTRETKSIASQAREVYDVSGAGDTVIALTAAANAAGLSMDDAMAVANLGAGIVVGRIGTYPISLLDMKQG